MQYSEDIGIGKNEPPLWGAVLLLVIFGWMFNLEVLNIRFLFDDIYLVVINPYIREGKNLLNYLDAGRPVRSLTLYIDYLLWNYNPRGYHVTNLLIHLAGIVAFFRFLDGRLTDRWTAWGAALLFSTHPAVSESLAVVSHRKEMLAFLFLILALWSYSAASEPGLVEKENKWPRLKRKLYLLSFVFYLIGLGSKQVVVVLPFLAFATDVFLSGEGAFKVLRRRWAWYLPYILTPLLFGILAMGDWRMFDYFPSGEILGEFHVRVLAISGWAVIAYLKLLLWPIFLSADHQIETPGLLSVLAGVFLWSAMLFFGWRLRKKSPSVAFGLVWIPLNLIAVLNIIPANQPLADRYLYIPLAGFCLTLAVALKYAAGRKSIVFDIFRWVLLIGVVYCFMIPSWNYVYGAESRGLSWAAPSVIISVLILRLVLFGVGGYGRKISFWKYVLIAAITLNTLFWVVTPVMDRLYRGEFKLPGKMKAENYFKKGKNLYKMSSGKTLPDRKNNFPVVFPIFIMAFVAFFFGFIIASFMRPPWSDGNVNLANWVMAVELVVFFLCIVNVGRLKEWQYSGGLWTATLRTDPGSARASINLGVYWKKHNNPRKAEWYYRRAAFINPRNPTLWYDLALLYIYEKDYMRAEDALKRAVLLDPGNVGALLNLSNIYYAKGLTGEALAIYRKVIDMDPRNSKALFNSALIYEKNGDYDSARTYCLKALEYRPDFTKAFRMCGPGGRLGAVPP